MHSYVNSSFDTVIIGGGHNGLVAAAYLAKAGKKILLLERNAHLGGATVSEQLFPDYQARLSRYAYLISLLPAKVMADLGLRLNLRRRRIASCTPYRHADREGGLLISNASTAVTQASLHSLSGGTDEYSRYRRFGGKLTTFAQKIWPTMLQPLQAKPELRNNFKTPEDKKIWDSLVEEPLGRLIESELETDLLRGIVLTDAKISAFTHAHNENLLQNRTFLYHVLGNGSGEWRVPEGGMGALVAQLEEICRTSGVTFRTGAAVEGIIPGPERHTVVYTEEGRQREVQSKYVLVNAAPALLDGWLGKPVRLQAEDEGSVFKINMLLKKLPRLRDTNLSPEDAFAGTLHIDESYTQLSASYQQAKAGKLPHKLPFEVYCHMLTDSSILSPQLAAQGYHTLTLFGLDVPYSLFENDPEGVKKEALAGYLAGLNNYLAEPVEECLAIDQSGMPCLEAKSPVDIARELNMPRGNIFHNALSWFYGESAEEVDSWGVGTGTDRIYLCGSGAKRGGAVSGIPGHNAAMQVLGGRF